MLRQSSQILAAVQTALFVLLIMNAPGVQSFAQDPPTTPLKAPDGDPGNPEKRTVSSETTVIGGWGESGKDGVSGTNTPAWKLPAPGASVGVRDYGEIGAAGVIGGAAGTGGQGGNLIITVTGDVDFSGFYTTTLGTTGGNGGRGGQGGQGQEGGAAFYSGQFARGQDQMDGALGGIGGKGADGAAGGAGGNLVFTLENGNVTFATGTVFGGTGGTGGDGGQGGQGGRGGFAGGAYYPYTDGFGGQGGAGGQGGDGGIGGAGGNAGFAINDGAITFDSVTFGGNGGNAGIGGAGGLGGLFGWGFESDDFNGAVGSTGSRGNGGKGGVGGNGSLTVNGGEVNFQGTTYFGGLGGLNADGTRAASGNGTLTANAGKLNLAGDMTFRGADSSFTLGRDAMLASGASTNQIQANSITLDGMVYIANGGILQLAADDGVYFGGTLNVGLGVDSLGSLDVLGNLTFGENAAVSLYGGGDEFFASLYDGWSFDLFSATGDVNGIEYLLANWSGCDANEEFNFTFSLAWDAATGILTLSAADVPEPATLVILGLGLAGLGVARRRK